MHKIHGFPFGKLNCDIVEDHEKLLVITAKGHSPSFLLSVFCIFSY